MYVLWVQFMYLVAKSPISWTGVINRLGRVGASRLQSIINEKYWIQIKKLFKYVKVQFLDVEGIRKI